MPKPLKTFALGKAALIWLTSADAIGAPP